VQIREALQAAAVPAAGSHNHKAAQILWPEPAADSGVGPLGQDTLRETAVFDGQLGGAISFKKRNDFGRSGVPKPHKQL